MMNLYRTTFRQTNASANFVGDAHSTPRSRNVAMNVSGVNHPLAACYANDDTIPSTFRSATAGVTGTYTLGANGFPSYFGISYSITTWLRNVFHVSSASSL